MPFKEIVFPQMESKTNNFLIVTGVSGVGKDFLLKQAHKVNPQMTTFVQVVDFGKELSNLLKVKFSITSRDQISSMLTQDQVLDSVNELVDSLRTPKSKILNTHVVYKQNDSLRINTDTIRRIDPCSYLFIWADPKEIQQRRISDTSRNRSSEPVDVIALHQDIAQSVVEAFARNYGAAMRNINNCQSNVVNNIEILFEQLEYLKH
jgi:adenylate kinase